MGARSFTAGQLGKRSRAEIVRNAETPQVMANTGIAEALRAAAGHHTGKALVG